MTIRPATIADAEQILQMGDRFLGIEGPYFGRFKSTPAALSRLLERMLQPSALALVLDRDVPGELELVGMFGAFVYEHPITGQLVGSELCWWVEPEARGRRQAVDLIKCGIEWARLAGAEWFEMIAPNERIGAFYERIGFERADVHYLKVLR